MFPDTGLLFNGLDYQKSCLHSSGWGNCQFSNQCLGVAPVPQFSCVKFSVATEGYKRGDSKMCMIWSMFNRSVTTMTDYQKKKQRIISSFLINTLTSKYLFEACISEATWPTNSTRLSVSSFSLKFFLKLLVYAYFF